jgi:hypothetical protein
MLHIIEPGFSHIDAHYLPNHQGLASLLPEVVMTCYAHRALGSIASGHKNLRIVPFFREFRGVMKGPGMIEDSEYLDPDIAAIVAAARSDDCVYVHSAYRHTLRSLVRVLERLEPVRRPHVAIRSFAYGPNWFMPEPDLLAAVKQMAQLLGLERFTFFVEMPAQRADLQERSPVPVKVLPTLFPDADRFPFQRARLPGSPVVVSFLGGPRVEKGFSYIPEIMRQTDVRVREAGISVKWNIQMGAEADKAKGTLSEIVQDIRNMARARSADICLFGSPDYRVTLEATDIFPLPYEPADYEKRGTSIGVEALLLGRPIVFRKGLMFEDLLGSAGHATEGLHAFAQKLADIAADYDTYRQAALAARARFLPTITNGEYLDVFRRFA